MSDFFSLAKSLSFFDGCSSRDYELIAGQSHIVTFSKGELLFYEDDESPFWFLLATGRLRTYKSARDDHEISLCTLEPGMAVNDLQLYKASYKVINFATAEALSDGMLIGIKASALGLLIGQIPTLALQCFHTVVTSVERYHRALYSGMILDAMGKVAFMLTHDLEKFNKMKKQAVASQLNIQPETLSRLLGKLSRKEIISTESGEIVILDPQALQSLYS